MTAPRTLGGAERQAAKAVVDCAIDALGVWVAAGVGNGDDTIDQNECSMLQVVARAIDESLDVAAAEADTADEGLTFMFGRNLVRLLDAALWNLMGNGSRVAVSRTALVGAAKMAIGQLTCVSAAMANARGDAK